MYQNKITLLTLIKQHYLRSFLILLFTSLLSGCASSKKINYFQIEEGQNLEGTTINYEPTIQFGDILTINVASLSPEAALPFNVYESQGTNGARPLPYIVNADGEINFPAIGKFKVAQLTNKEVTNELHNKLLPYLNNPIVNVRINNFKVSVLGEVRNPGSYTIQNERINILEAIALAGDLTIFGKRKPVTLIREQNGERTSLSIDLTNKDLFKSPYYYLAQNDIIYVESNRARVNSSAVGPNTSVILSALSLLVSIAAIIILR